MWTELLFAKSNRRNNEFNKYKLHNLYLLTTEDNETYDNYDIYRLIKNQKLDILSIIIHSNSYKLNPNVIASNRINHLFLDAYHKFDDEQLKMLKRNNTDVYYIKYEPEYD